MSCLLASLHPDWVKFEGSQRMHLTCAVCCPPLNMLHCNGVGIRPMTVTGVCFPYKCMATRKWGHFTRPDAICVCTLRNDSGLIEVELMNDQLHPEHGHGIAGSNSIFFTFFSAGEVKALYIGSSAAVRGQIIWLFYFFFPSTRLQHVITRVN